MFPAVIGIDLGSANVRWARAEYQGLKQPRIVPIGNSFEGITTAFTITEPRDTRKIGTDALVKNPSNIIFDSARVVFPSGDRANHYYAELHEEQWEQYYVIRAGQKQFKRSVPEVIGEILNGIKLVAEEELGCPILHAVLTVPSMAGTTHRRMLQQASKIAGLETKLINQSTAAALAFRHHTGGCPTEGVVLVFSMGSRTTECSIFEFTNYKTPKLCHSDGFFNFGGESFTDHLVEWLRKYLSAQHKEKWIELGKRLDPEGVKVLKCKLRREAEKAKAGLSHLEETGVLFEPDPEFGPCQCVLDRSQFRKFCAKMVDKVNKLIVDVLQFCPKNNLTISHVMLAGASSKLFIISELLKQHLPDATFINRDAVPPGLAALRGATIWAALWEAKFGSGGTVPQCLGRLEMPDFAYHRLGAKQLDGTRCIVADVGMELPTRPLSIMFGQTSHHIELLEVCGADKTVQKIGHCSNLQHSDCIQLSLDENGLLKLAMKNQRRQTLSTSKFRLDRQKNVMAEDKLERACREMCEHNERIRRETEEARKRWEEESTMMLEEQMEEAYNLI